MKALTFLILGLTMISSTMQSDFLKDQKRYSRVRSALLDKEELIKANLRENEIELGDLNILICAYKAEQELEIYAKRKEQTTYKRIKQYSVCASSGQLGPKRKQGDLQVPEGFYFIDRFNPASNFHLSLGLNYPNQSDRIKSSFSDLGGDIFIHGSCVTIGCLPMTDDKIKEIYLYAIHARNNGQTKIPVYVFPFRMTDENFNRYTEDNSDQADFWSNLKTGYEKFNSDKKELMIAFTDDGDYIF